MPACASPHSWQRQMLVHLTLSGWSAVRTAAWPAEAAACLEHWQAQDLPLVVARQDLGAGGMPTASDTLLLGLPAPLRWSRRRLALRVALSHLDRPAPWPSLDALLKNGVNPQAPTAWHTLPASLQQVGLTAQVYGSHGWQWLTGLPYLREGSDLDLLLAVPDAQAATLAAELLTQADTGPAALDGELVFPDGRAVNWREWRRWSLGATRQVLFKSLSGATLAAPEARMPGC